jgi:2-aminoethylphosphonate dioxygenase
MLLVGDDPEGFRECLARYGYAVVRGLLTPSCVDQAAKALSAVLAGAPEAGDSDPEHRGVIVEADPNGRNIFKLERLVAADPFFGRLSEELSAMLTRLLKQPYCLFKDKINIRPAGDGGFGFHQDYESYRHHAPRYHVTAMVGFVPATTCNGCLHMAWDYRRDLLSEDVSRQLGEHCLLSFMERGTARGNLVPHLASRFKWVPICTAVSDVVFFDSFVPHGSKGNRTGSARPALFLTFVPGAGSAQYERYYYERQQRRRASAHSAGSDTDL